MSNYLDDVHEFVFDINNVYEVIDAKETISGADRIFDNASGYGWYTLEEIKHKSKTYYMLYKLNGEIREVILNQIDVKQIMGNRALLSTKRLLESLNRGLIHE